MNAWQALVKCKRAIRPRSRIFDGLEWLQGYFPRHFWRMVEAVKYACVIPRRHLCFHIVSCERKAGEHVLRCLQSVYDQRYPKECIRHVLIDDDSPDDTDRLVRQWLAEHPDHRVEYIRNPVRMWGGANCQQGFAMAAPGSIVCQLDGDDWLPDRGVIAFLNKVYQNPSVWVTYNTWVYPDGRLAWKLAYPFSKDVYARNAFREGRNWGSAMHSFRSEILGHIPKQYLLNPDTGKHWGPAEDVSYYLPMFELAGRHARHIYRPTYVYNIRDESVANSMPGLPLENELRIRKLPALKPLQSLSNDTHA